MEFRYGRFGTRNQFIFEGEAFKERIGLLDLCRRDKYVFPKRRVTDHQPSLRNIPEEWRSQVHSGRSLNSRIFYSCIVQLMGAICMEARTISNVCVVLRPLDNYSHKCVGKMTADDLKTEENSCSRMTFWNTPESVRK